MPTKIKLPVKFGEPEDSTHLILITDAEGEVVAEASVREHAEAITRALNSAAQLNNALDLLWRHHQDIADSNPGFMRKLTLQDYSLWNTAMLEAGAAWERWCKPPVPIKKG